MVGYPTAVVVLVRFVPVVRERRVRWLAAHQLAMAAIVTGWVIRGEPAGVAVNAAWFVVAGAWYALGGRRP